MIIKTFSDVPKTGLAGLKAHWRQDFLSGFLVFLIALPLCLGISMASGFPPAAGIITAVVGGMVVSRCSGSFVTINGPAAGLIVVVLDAVQSMGEGDAMAGYRYTLAAIVIASILQIAMGIFKFGRLSSFFPASVVHGMLAAIGIIIMAKQIHVVLGVTPEKGNLVSTISQIPHSLVNLNPEIGIIGFTGIFILIVWSMIKNPTLKMIPAPLIVVLVGIGFGKIFDLDHEHLYLFLPDSTFLSHHEATIGPKFLVTISDNFMSSFYSPDFSKITSTDFWHHVITIALVGSLESLLSTMAVDKLDPYKRHSNLNRDLAAVGMGNLIAGSIGGLPMIAEIVRSSANVTNGAKTSWANFFHGSILLLFVVFFPKLIHSIPLAALAALLVFTGFRLASPKEFLNVWKIGKDQLFLFVATIIGVITTDLLIGVAIGVSLKALLHLLRGVSFNNLLKMNYSITKTINNECLVVINNAAVFSNILKFKEAVGQFQLDEAIVFDLSQSSFLDHSMMEFLHKFEHDWVSRGGQCKIIGADHLRAVSFHPLAVRKK